MKSRLYRSRGGKMIGGVCTGLADYFGIDPVLIRLLFIVLLFFNGVGLLAYIILWIVVPWQPEYIPAPVVEQAEEGEPELATAHANESAGKVNGKGHTATGYVLIGIGVLFLFNNFLPGFSFRDFWPLLLIALGIAVLWNSSPRHTVSEVES
jgi:phage shock protein C